MANETIGENAELPDPFTALVMSQGEDGAAQLVGTVKSLHRQSVQEEQQRAAVEVSTCPMCGNTGDHTGGRRTPDGTAPPLHRCTRCGTEYLVCPFCGGREMGLNHLCPDSGKLLE